MPDQANNSILGPTVVADKDSAENVIAQRLASIAPPEQPGGPEIANAPGAFGAMGTAYTASNAAVDFQYAVVPASTLVTSHGTDLSVNPDYNQSLQGQFVQADGGATAGGIRQAQNALLAAAYPDTSRLSRMLESTDDNTRNIGTGMLSAAGDIAGLRQGAERGDLHPLDISGNISDAAGLLSRLRDEGTPLANHLATGSLFGEALPPVTENIARFMDANKRSGKRIGQVLSAYAGSVQALGSPDQEALFDMPPPSPDEMFSAARFSVEDQHGVLASAGGPSAASPEIEAARIEEAQQRAERERVKTDAARADRPSARADRPSGRTSASSSSGGRGGAWDEDAHNALVRPVSGSRAPDPPSTITATQSYSSSDSMNAVKSRAKWEEFKSRPALPPAQTADDIVSSFSDAGSSVSRSSVSSEQPFATYEQAAKAKGEIVAKKRDAYTARGDFGLIELPGFDAEVQEALQSKGIVSPLEKPTPFEEARSKYSDITRDLNDTYSSQGRFLDIGKTKEYDSDLRRMAHQEGLGPEPEAEHDDNLLRPHAAAQKRRSGIEAMVKDDYALRGDFKEIGGEDFRKDVHSELVEAGLAKEERRGLGGAIDRIKEDKVGVAFGIGYSAMSVGSGVAQLAELDKGQYVAPEDRSAAEFNAAAPAAAGIVGTLLGTAIGGAAGGLAGQFIGGAVGQAGSAVFGASEAREQSTRETAERLAAALGQAAESVGTFKAQIEATGAPVAQLGQSLQAVGAVGTLGGGSVAGVGALTNAFQERAGEDFAAVAKYTSNPLLYGLGNRFSTGAAGSTDLQALGFDAAENGDFSGLVTFQQAAHDARVKDDPAYQAAAKRLQGDSNSLLGLGAFGVAGTKFLRDHGYRPNTDINADLQTEDDQKAAAGTDPVADAQNTLINQFAKFRSDDIVAGAGIQAAGTGIGLVTARGGSAAQIAQASEALYAGLVAAKAATQGEIGLLQSDLANPVNAGRAGELTAKIAQEQAKIGGYDVQEAQQRKSVFQDALGEEDAGFSLTTTRGTLSGRSAASLSGDYRRQEEYLSGVAADPRNPLSPTERAGIESGVAQMRYEQAQHVYGEENAGLGIIRAEREGTQQRESILGTPESQYEAALGTVASDRQQIAQNQSEIRRGNLTRPQILGLERQDVQIQTDIDVTPERARVAAYDAEGSILGSEQSAGRAELSRAQSVYGAKAFTPAIFAEDQAEVNLYTGAEAGSPLGSSQRARFGVERAQSVAREQEDRDASYQFGDQATRVRETRAEGRFNRAMKNPYQDGDPDNNPMTRGREYEGVLKADLSKAEVALKATPQDSPAFEKNTETVERYKDQIADLEEKRRRGFEEMLPEMIAGSPGSGRLTGILPTAGQAAYYNPNAFMHGTFGKPDRNEVYDGEHHTPQPGGAAGAFLAVTGAATTGTGNAAGGITSADARALAAAMHRFVDFASRSTQGGGRSPVVPNGSTGKINPYGFNGGM